MIMHSGSFAIGSAEPDLPPPGGRLSLARWRYSGNNTLRLAQNPVMTIMKTASVCRKKSGHTEGVSQESYTEKPAVGQSAGQTALERAEMGKGQRISGSKRNTLGK